MKNLNMIGGLASIVVSAILSASAVIAAVANDECEDAEPITGQGVFVFDNTLATMDGAVTGLCVDEYWTPSPFLPHDVWFCWTSPFTGSVSIDTCGRTTVDTRIAVYNGCASCPPDFARELACSDDHCSTQSRASFDAVADQNYLIRIGTTDDDDLGGGSGTFAIDYGAPLVWADVPASCDELADVGQPPDQWDVLTSDRVNLVVADNFVPAVGGEIDQLCWWGTYLQDLGNWGDVSLDAFEVRYYENDGGVPGNLLAGPFEQAVNTLDVHGPILEPRLLSEGQRQYGYAAFHEPVPVIAGECYWLEISNASLFESQWQWANSALGDGRALQDGGLENVPDGYSYVDAVVEDMAFVLSVPLSTERDCYLAPGNDFCADSQPIEEGLVSFDTTGATTDGPPVPLRSEIPTTECGFPLGDEQVHGDIWFDFFAECSGLLTINLCESQFDAKIAIYESGDCAELGVPIACNDDACGDESGRQSALVVSLDDEADLKIRVGGYNVATGPGVIDLSFLIAPPPIVDLFDYSKFAACFTGPCPAASCDVPLYAPGCCQAQDYEVDGDVDLEDFVKFHQALISPTSAEVTFDWTIVGNPGNAADPLNEGDIPGIGSVAYAYRIAKHEVTNEQYAEFLNAVAVTDTNGLYSTNMGLDARRAGIIQGGTSGSFTYGVKANMGNKPVNYVSFFDAMRFVNWLHNRQPTGAQDASTTEDGVYTISDGLSETRATDALFFIPTENEWYKAAYHQPSADGGDADDYWFYPTAGNSVPTIATANTTGDISNPGTSVANYDEGADWNGEDGNVTTVGSAGAASQSYYATSDQGGNVFEWNERALFDPVSRRGMRGGAWNSRFEFLLSSVQFSLVPTSETRSLGFRVGSALLDRNNNSSIVDADDIANMTSPDCDGNGVLDECQINEGSTTSDGNENGGSNECDVDVTDPDAHGQVDPDVNGDGISDRCDLGSPIDAPPAYDRARNRYISSPQ